MGKFDREIKIPKDRSYCREGVFCGFYVNAGYKDKNGEDACVERIALSRLIELVQCIQTRRGYRWNAVHIRFTVIAKSQQKSLSNDVEDASRCGDAVIRAVKKEIEKRNDKAIIHYRWHLEWSETAGWHYHVAFFLNGNALKGTTALETEFWKQGVASVQAICPDFTRTRKGPARDYFESRGLVVDNSKKFLPLQNDIDFEYSIYWFSYMTKKATKELAVQSKVRTTGGTSLKRFKGA